MGGQKVKSGRINNSRLVHGWDTSAARSEPLSDSFLRKMLSENDIEIVTFHCPKSLSVAPAMHQTEICDLPKSSFFVTKVENKKYKTKIFFILRFGRPKSQVLADHRFSFGAWLGHISYQIRASEHFIFAENVV